MSNEAYMRTKANRLLSKTIKPYHPGLPIELIDQALVGGGFKSMEPAIYCGREGRVHEQVGPRTWIAMNWFKQDSGRYEVTVYVS